MERSRRHAAPEASPQEPASTAAAAEALCSMHPAAPPSSSATGAAASGHHRRGLDAAGTRPDPLCLNSPSKAHGAAAAANQRRSGRQAAARGQNGSNAGGGPSSSRGAAAEASEAAASLEDAAAAAASCASIYAQHELGGARDGDVHREASEIILQMLTRQAATGCRMPCPRAGSTWLASVSSRDAVYEVRGSREREWKTKEALQIQVIALKIDFVTPCSFGPKKEATLVSKSTL